MKPPEAGLVSSLPNVFWERWLAPDASPVVMSLDGLGCSIITYGYWNTGSAGLYSSYLIGIGSFKTKTPYDRGSDFSGLAPSRRS